MFSKYVVRSNTFFVCSKNWCLFNNTYIHTYIVEKCYIFFFSSLLIVYEGKDKQSKSRNFDSSVSFEDMSADEDANVHLEGELKNYPKVTVKMIDFANCTFRGFLNDSVIHVGPDLGYLQGLDTLIHILLQTLEDDSQQ